MLCRHAYIIEPLILSRLFKSQTASHPTRNISFSVMSGLVFFFSSLRTFIARLGEGDSAAWCGEDEQLMQYRLSMTCGLRQPMANLC